MERKQPPPAPPDFEIKTKNRAEEWLTGPGAIQRALAKGKQYRKLDVVDERVSLSGRVLRLRRVPSSTLTVSEVSQDETAQETIFMRVLHTMASLDPEMESNFGNLTVHETEYLTTSGAVDSAKEFRFEQTDFTGLVPLTDDDAAAVGTILIAVYRCRTHTGRGDPERPNIRANELIAETVINLHELIQFHSTSRPFAGWLPLSGTQDVPGADCLQVEIEITATTCPDLPQTALPPYVRFKV